MGFFKNPLGAIATAVNPVALLGSALAGGTEIFSAIQERQAMKDANAANELQAREQMQFSAAQADKQMAFQERMAGSAHQRQVADLRAAGLNPLLAANSGAPSPGGAAGAPAGFSAQALPAVMQRFLSSARENIMRSMEYRLGKSELETQRRQRINIDLDSNLKDAQARYQDKLREGVELDNALSLNRNRFFSSNPWAFKLHTISGGMGSAGSLLRNVTESLSKFGGSKAKKK